MSTHSMGGIRPRKSAVRCAFSNWGTTVACAAILTFVGVLPGLAFAQSPALINYQGRLTDEGENGISGTLELEVWIYPVESGGTAIWGPQVFPAVPVINGHFNIILGDKDAADPQRSIEDAFNDPVRYLAVRILKKDGVSVPNPQEIAPRQQILSVPYAINAVGKNVLNLGYLGLGLGDVGKVAAVNLTAKTYGLSYDFPGQEDTLPRGIYLGEGKLQVSGLYSVGTGAMSLVEGGGLQEGKLYYLAQTEADKGKITAVAPPGRIYATLIGYAASAQKLILDIRKVQMTDFVLPDENQVRNSDFTQGTVNEPTYWDANPSSSIAVNGTPPCLPFTEATSGHNSFAAAPAQDVAISSSLQAVVDANNLQIDFGGTGRASSSFPSSVGYMRIAFLNASKTPLLGAPVHDLTFSNGTTCETKMASDEPSGKRCVPAGCKYIRIYIWDESSGYQFSNVALTYHYDEAGDCP